MPSSSSPLLPIEPGNTSNFSRSCNISCWRWSPTPASDHRCQEREVKEDKGRNQDDRSDSKRLDATIAPPGKAGAGASRGQNPGASCSVVSAVLGAVPVRDNCGGFAESQMQKSLHLTAMEVSARSTRRCRPQTMLLRRHQGVPVWESDPVPSTGISSSVLARRVAGLPSF